MWCIGQVAISVQMANINVWDRFGYWISKLVFGYFQNIIILVFVVDVLALDLVFFCKVGQNYVQSELSVTLRKNVTTIYKNVISMRQ